jgi:ureidoacrylate peracid hydrolase
MDSRLNRQRRKLLAGLAATPLVNMRLAASDSKPPQARARLLSMDAKPAPTTLDAAKTAVIVVDMQNDFGSPGGMFDLAGIDITGIRSAIEPTAKVLVAARRAGLPIVYLKMAFRPDLSDLGAPDSPNRVRHLRLRVGEKIRSPDGREGRVLIRDT